MQTQSAAAVKPQHKYKRAIEISSRVLSALFKLFFFVGLGFVLLYPVLYLLSNAFKANIDAVDPTVVWIPKNYTLNNFILAWNTMDATKVILDTLKMLVPSVILQTFVCFMVGYGFARFKFKEREILFVLLLFTIIVPVQTYVIPLYVNFRYFDFLGIGRIIGWFTGEPATVNLLSSPTPFWIMSALGMGIRSPLYIFISRQFFRGMPKELEEAALIDGCGPMQAFVRIMLPNAKSVMLTIFLFSVVWHWNDFYLTSMIYQNNYPISVAVTLLTQRLNTIKATEATANLELMKSAVVEASCFIALMPLLIIYLFTQKHFTESIERTGIVG